MGTGYTRNDVSNNIANGNIIDADDLDGEFNAIQSAFAITGHTHDGTSAEGGPITVIGPVQDFVASAVAYYPKASNTYDLGSSSLKWKDIYIDGVANIDTLTAGAGTVGGANIVTVSATQALTNKTLTSPTVSGGTINNAVIGGVTPAAITGTTITASTGFTGNLTGNADTATNATSADTATTLTGLTANTSELNILDGATVTTAELNYVAGVTSPIQTQLNAKLEAIDLGTYTGDVNITGELTVDSYNESFVTLSGTSPSINCEAGNVFSITLTGNTTFTFSNPPATGTAYGFTLKIVQDATVRTVTWPGSVDWAGGTAPDAPASGETDVLVFWTSDGGTTWYGFLAGDNLS